MSFLLMVFLTLVCVPDGYPQPYWVGSPAASAMLTGLVLALVGLHAFHVARGVRRPLALDPSQPERVLRRYERLRAVHQYLLIGAYVLALAGLGWGWAVSKFWSRGDTALPGTELLLLAPFLAGQLLSWLFFYDADRAAHQAVHRDHALAPPGYGGRLAYVLFQARQKLALVFIPVLLLIAQKELLRLLPEPWREEWQLAVQLAGCLAVLALFAAMPWVIRLALGLKPLPAGALRDRLEATARRLRFACTDLLLWNTRHGMANALVVGVLPWLRYVVFTDRLLEEFTEEEVEAVFGHEVGHVKHRHMLCYLGFLVVSMAVLGLVIRQYVEQGLAAAGAVVTSYFPEWSAAAAAQLEGAQGHLALLPMVVFMLAYIFVVFGFLSRRCERQADVFGCRAVSCDDPDCVGHEPGLALPPDGRGLCPTGVRVFIGALEKVALLNGISRDRPGFLQSWQHSTIARRVAFLQRVLADTSVAAAFQRRVGLVKWALFAGLGVALGLLVYLHGWQALVG